MPSPRPPSRGGGTPGPGSGPARAALSHQHALTDDDLHRYAAQLGLDLARFDRDRPSAAVLARIRRDVDSGVAWVAAARRCSSTVASTTPRPDTTAEM
jgi:hypothetical protein